MQYEAEHWQTLNALDHLDFLFCVSRENKKEKRELHYFSLGMVAL